MRFKLENDYFGLNIFCNVEKDCKQIQSSNILSCSNFVFPFVLETLLTTNIDLYVEDMYRNFPKCRYWKCPVCKHEWCQSVYSMKCEYDKNLPTVCPECLHKKLSVQWRVKDQEKTTRRKAKQVYAVPGINDLKTLYPDIAAEWDYDAEENKGWSPETITAHSQKIIHWKCAKGHKWPARVGSRTNGSNCPRCSYGGHSFPEQGVAYYLKQICKVEQRKRFFSRTEVDIFLPDYNIGIEYDGLYFHQNKRQFDKQKNQRLTNAGITMIHIIESDHNSIDKLNVYFSVQQRRVNYNWAVRQVCNLLTELTNNLKFNEVDINVDRDWVQIREQFNLTKKANSLAEICPSIAKEWHPTKNGTLSPDMFTYKSAETVWWKCFKCGREYQMPIVRRSAGSGCNCHTIPKTQPVKCVETNEHYNTMVDAAQMVYPTLKKSTAVQGIKSAAVTHLDYKGFHWEFIT